MTFFFFFWKISKWLHLGGSWDNSPLFNDYNIFYSRDLEAVAKLDEFRFGE